MKTHLVETGSWSKDDISRISTLKEYVQLENKPKIQEALSTYPELDAMGKSVYRVPISVYDVVNLNGRMYPKSLWERVIKEQRHIWEGSVGLADHPEEGKEGSFRNVATVWLGMYLDESTKRVWGDVVFVGEYGRLAEEIMLAGGRVGFSTSGFGELTEETVNGVTYKKVIPETYEIERPADLVVNPSQSVWGTKDMKLVTPDRTTNQPLPGVNPMNRPAKEDLRFESVNKFLKDKTTNTTEERGERLVMSKVEEKIFRKMVSEMLQEAEAVESPKEKLSSLEEILSLFDDGYGPEDLKAVVLNKIEEQKKLLDKLVEAGTIIKNALGEEIIEKPMEALKALDEAITSDLNNVKNDAEAQIALLEDRIQLLEKRIQELSYAEKQVSILTSKVNEKTVQIKNLLEEKKRSQQRIKEFVHRIRSLEEEVKTKERESAETQALLEKNIAMIKERYALLEKKHLKLLKERMQTRALLKEARDRLAKYRQYQEDGYLSQIRNIQEKKTRHQETIKAFQEPEVVEFWKDIYSTQGNRVLPLKESILRCKTLREAVSVYLKHFSEEDSTVESSERQAVSHGGVSSLDYDGPLTPFGSPMPKGWV